MILVWDKYSIEKVEKSMKKGDKVFCWDTIKSIGKEYTFEQMWGNKYLVKSNNKPDNYVAWKNATVINTWVEHDGGFPRVALDVEIEIETVDGRRLVNTPTLFNWVKYDTGNDIARWRKV